MAKMNYFLSGEKSLQLIQKLKDSEMNFVYDKPKHRIILLDHLHNELLYFRLPIHFHSYPNALDIHGDEVNYIILLIQAGASAVGLYQDEENLDHKAFKSYMVRKKQGKSQVKYLKTRGKSKAGSRVRLGNTIEFFENINERLQDYFEEQQIDRIAISCSKTLWPYIFNSKVDCPFDKNDDRIIKIPKHVHEPTYEILTNIHHFLLRGELIYEDKQKELAEDLLKGIK